MTDSRPIYDRVHDVAGYDEETNRWRTGDGRFTTEEEVMSQPRTPAMAGRVIELPNFHRVSTLAERFEEVIGGGIRISAQRDFDSGTEPMPSAILGMMRMAEYYCNSEGDVYETIEVPLDIALKQLDFKSPDGKFRDDLEELYSEINIDMYQTLYYIWLCSGIYGQAFPLEIIADKADIESTRVLLIPPKNVDVGRSFILGSSMTVRPPESAAAWTQQLSRIAFPEMAYNRRAIDFNESVPEGADVVINPSRCVPVREKSLPFQRYAVPPLMRASRAISTRRIFEEMRRATVEGIKNQLWMFLLGDAEHMPLPAEISHLANAVSGLYGERTGALVWTGNLKVELVAPQAPDALMGNETYVGLTMEIFRRLGISMKLVSGERGPLGGGSARAGDIELDLSVLLERLRFKMGQMYRWERQFRSKLAEAMGPAAVKANEKTDVRFGFINVENERAIRERLLPTYQSGVLSIQTFLEEGGWNWLTELKNKKEEEKLKHLFSPPASFAQTVVRPPGAGAPPPPGEKAPGDKTTEQTVPPGRPPNDNSKLPEKSVEEVKAAVDDVIITGSFESYLNAVYGEFDKMVAGGSTVRQFIGSLKTINRENMYEFAVEGYKDGGGVHVEPPGLRDWANRAVSFVNSFADGFGERLEYQQEQGYSLETLRWNTYLYPQEGRHLAYMYGLQWAMKERGASSWMRILHPEQSTTGPCESCTADSIIVHPIEEPFFEFHPNGVCSAQGVGFFVGPPGEPPMVEIPVPRKVFDPHMILEILRRLGQRATQFIRRIRGE